MSFIYRYVTFHCRFLQQLLQALINSLAIAKKILCACLCFEVNTPYYRNKLGIETMHQIQTPPLLLVRKLRIGRNSE